MILRQQRLHGLGHERLQRVVRERHLDAGHVRDLRRPAGDGRHHGAGRDRAAVGLDADAAAVLDLEAGDLDALVDVHAAGVGLAGVAPHDRVVADHGARRVVERALDRVGDLARHVELRAEARDLVGLDPARVDAHQLVGLGALALHRHGALGVREREVAVRRDQQVEVELLRELLVDLEALAVERDALGRLVVGAQDRRVAARAAGADVVHLEHGDVRDAALRQLVGGREAVRAAADDDDVVGGRRGRARARTA